MNTIITKKDIKKTTAPKQESWFFFTQDVH